MGAKGNNKGEVSSLLQVQGDTKAEAGSLLTPQLCSTLTFWLYVEISMLVAAECHSTSNPTFHVLHADVELRTLHSIYMHIHYANESFLAKGRKIKPLIFYLLHDLFFVFYLF